MAIATRTVLTEYDPKPGVGIATLSYEYPSQYQVPEHAHGSDQLIYAISGVMEVSSGHSVWLIPPHFALWIPARIEHRIYMPGPVSMRTLYVRWGFGDGAHVSVQRFARGATPARTDYRNRAVGSDQAEEAL